MRQFLAAAIVVAGHRFIVERRFLPYLLVVTMAGLFHVSAFAFILLYFVPQKRLRAPALLLLLGVAMVALYSSDAVINVIATVTEGDYTGQAYIFRQVNWLRIAVAVVPVGLYSMRAVEFTPREWFYRNMAVIHAAVMLAASGSAYLARFGIYTSAFLPMFIPRLVKFENRGLTILARSVVLLLFLVYWYVEASGPSGLNEFHWIFDRPPESTNGA